MEYIIDCEFDKERRGSRMSKTHSSFRVAFPIAAVWFGALVGPSMVSGAFAVGVVTLGAWESALFKNCSLSERSEFEHFLNAFSRFPRT